MAEGSKNIHQIAESLVVKRDPPADPPVTDDDTSPIVGDEAQDEGDEDEQDVSDTSDDEEGDGQQDDDQDEVDGQDDEDDQGGNTLDVSDDDLIEVTIDGETQTKTLRELKEAISGEGAISKRLQEATEARKAAQAERAKVETQAETTREAMVRVVQALDQQLFTPRIQAPDESLRASNPKKYLEVEAAYRQEQQRIQDGRQTLAQLFEAQHQAVQEDLKELRKNEATKLREVIPEIADPEKGKAKRELILDSAKYYGFSDDEVKNGADHRMFWMAHDAALYRKSKEKAVVKDDKSENQGQKRPPRVLRSGKTTAGKRRVQQASKEQRAARDKAQETGKPQDVAKLLLKPTRKSRGR